MQIAKCRYARKAPLVPCCYTSCDQWQVETRPVVELIYGVNSALLSLDAWYAVRSDSKVERQMQS